MTTATTSNSSSRGAKRSGPPDDRASAYARAVVVEQIPACKWVRLACERHLRDLAEAPGRGLGWDAAAAAEAIAFFRGLHHSKGEWAGRLIELEPWQCFLVGSLFGWKRSDGTRRFRTALAEVPRRNGKSTLAAGVGLLLCFFDNEPGADVFAAATKRDQAKLVWGEAKRMVQQTPALRRRITIRQANLHADRSASKFEPLGADADNLDGLNIHGAIVDELHAHKTRAMWDVLETATGSRRQPLIFAITTAGSNRAGVCYDQHLFAQKILEGTVTEDSYFAVIYTIDEGDDWTDPAAWAKANPNLGVSVKRDELAALARRAREMPSAQAAFLTKRLNVWVNADVAWLPAEAWARGATQFTEADLTGLPYTVGLDLASKTDLAARARLWWRDDADGQRHFYAKLQCYLPSEVGRAASPESTNYPGWAAAGWITLTPGNVIDFATIKADLRGDLQAQAIAYDPWQAEQLAQELVAEGAPMVELRPTTENFSAPMKELEALVVSGRLHHDGNPVLAWMLSNVVCHRDAKDNIYPRKPAPHLKIDGVVALLMALNRALLQPAPFRSLYEDRGLLVL